MKLSTLKILQPVYLFSFILVDDIYKKTFKSTWADFNALKLMNTIENSEVANRLNIRDDSISDWDLCVLQG